MYFYRKSPFKYDFTYVTDVANGICNALKERVTSCGVVYDLGSGSPQEVTVAADILKKELNKEATNVRTICTAFICTVHIIHKFLVGKLSTFNVIHF